MSVCIILCNSAYYGCLHFSLLSSCICISLLRRPKIKLHQVVIKDDDHSALTLTSSFLLLPHLADVEAAAMAFVTLRVTEPDLGSGSTNPRDAKCGLFFFVRRELLFRGMSWGVAGAAAPVGRARLSLKRRRPDGPHPPSQPCRRCDSALEKKWPSYCSLTRLNYKRRHVAAFRLFKRLI